MNQQEKISPVQLGILVAFYCIGTAILITPSSLAGMAKQDAWISTIAGLGLALLLVFLYTTLGSKFPDKSLFEVHELLLGKWLGKFISLQFIIFTLLPAAMLVNFVGNFMTTHIMPRTPIEAIHILFTLIVIMAVRYGIETIARTAEILFPWFMGLFLVFAIGISPQIRWENMQPFLENGIKPVIESTISFTSIFTFSPVLFLMIFPVHVEDLKKGKRFFYYGTILAGVVMLIVTLLSVLVLGPDMTGRNLYPSYVLAKKIDIGNFFQRIEAIMAGMWVMSIYFRLVLYFYVTTNGIAQIFQLKDTRSLTFPLAAIMIVLADVIFPNWIYAMDWLKRYWYLYGFTYGVLLPVILLVLAGIRQNSGSDRHQ